MSIVNANQNIRKKDEEEEKKKQQQQNVVGQQQKTQKESSKPTGSTSIPKDNQGTSRTQKGTASSLRKENNVTTTASTPRREESKTNIIRRNTVTANRAEQQNNQQTTNRRGEERRSYQTGNENKTTNTNNQIPSPSMLPKANSTSNNIPTNVISQYADKYGISYDEAKSKFEKAQNMANQTITKPGQINEDKTSQARAERAEELRKANQKQQTAYESFMTNMGKTLADPVNLLPFAAGKLTGNNWDLVGDKAREAEKQATEQHPVASAAGDIAGFLLGNKILRGGSANSAAASAGDVGKAAYEDAILNGATKGQALANGLSNAARTTGLNAVKEFAKTDLPLDTLPYVMNSIIEGKSNKEIARDAALNVGANVGFNALGDVVSAANALRKAGKNIPNGVPEVIEQAAKEEPEVVEQAVRNAVPEMDEAETLIRPNINNALGSSGASQLKDVELANLARQGGASGPMSQVYSDLLEAVDGQSIDEAKRVADIYADVAKQNNVQGVDDILNRLNGYVENGIPNVSENLGDSVGTNVKQISDELNKLDAIGVPPTKLGNDWLAEAHNALTDYQNAVTNGGDVMAARDNLDRILSNLNKQANKLDDYNGSFSKYKGMGTPRGDLYINSDQFPKQLSPEEQAFWDSQMDEWTEMANKNRYAVPANQVPSANGVETANEAIENVARNADNEIPNAQNFARANEGVPSINNTRPIEAPKTVADTNIPVEDIKPDTEPSMRFGKSKVVTNTGINADIITREQLENDPVIKDIMQYEKHSNVQTMDEAALRVSKDAKVWRDGFISGERAIESDTDVDTAMMLMQDLNRKMEGAADDAAREVLANQKNAIFRKLREFGTKSGQNVQAFAKWNNTPEGAMLCATKVQDDDIIKPWVSKNQKQVAGNSRIAQALRKMGDDTKVSKEATKLTHDQIKEGVRAEIEREVGSVENYFNENDIEFLTQLAEDKSIPVWQITDEIEHKLNNGTWYTLDESIEKPKYTNRKLNNALNELIEGGNVRKETSELSAKEIREQVVNTLDREAASFDGQFDDSDVDYLTNLIQSGATKQELTDALNTKMATGRFGISADTQQKVNDLFKEASMYDPNSKDFVERQAEAFRLLAEEIAPDATALEKFDAWRYIAMLGNPKTMLRNYVGNQMFGVVTGVSNNMAALGEAGIDKASRAFGGEGIQRTKSVLNPFTDDNLIKASALDADNSVYRQLQGSKYEKMDKDALRKSRSVFNSKIMQKIEKAVDAGISDYSAIKKKYSTSLAGYLKANGYDKSIFEAETKLKRLKNLSETQVLTSAEKQTMEQLKKDVEALDKARDYAVKQAEYATFHEDNAFAKWLTQVSNSAPGVGKAIIEGTVPFKKTPANVLKSGVQYSPLGAIDSLRKTGKLIYENTGKRAGNLADTYVNSKGKEVSKTLASDVIESWAKTLTGTGLTGLGAYLYSKGALIDSDNDTKYQDQLEGLQNYSIKINGKTYTIDWMAPSAMSLLLGAELKKVWDGRGESEDKWYKNLDKYLSAANKIADPLIETSFLSGVSDTIETAANAVRDKDFMSIPAMIGYNAATGYATQAVPTISGQIARTVDNTRRSNYTDKEGAAGVLEKQGKKILNKIPFLSELNQPYVDTYGREQTNSPSDNPLINFAYQSLSPGYLADVNTTPADQLSRDVYNNMQVQDDKVLPQFQSSLKIDGERVSPEKYTEFAKTYGETNYNIRDELTNNEWFNGLNNDEKAEILGDINNIAKNVGQAAVIDDFSSESKPYMAYAEGGVNGLVEYYKDQQIKSKAKESGLSGSSNASKAIQEDLRNGDEEAAQQKIDAANALSAYDLPLAKAADAYFGAVQNNPSLNVDEFAKTYKDIDTDNNGIKNAEIIDFLNRKKVTSEAEAKDIWQTYGGGEKSTPKLKNGEWTTGKTSTKGTDKSAEVPATGNSTLDARLKAKEKMREDAKNNSLPGAEDLPKAESTAEETTDSSGLNWQLNNGYDLASTQTYQRAKAAGVSDADFNNAWWAADADGNGYMKKAEAWNYASQFPTKEEQQMWFHILYKGR